MEKQDDNKIRSITYLVRSLTVVTLTTVGLTILLLCNAFAKNFTGEVKPSFGCGTCTAPCGMKNDNRNYVLNGKDGKALFKTNCSSCHQIDKDGTGPGLRGVLERIPAGEWKYNFVHDHGAMIKSGDAYAIQLYSKYKTIGTAFPQLSNDEIDAILLYANQ